MLARLMNKMKSIATTLSNHLLFYPTPSSMTYMWSFGSLVGLIFSIQIITGVFLAMHYTPHIDLAFQSVEHIMTDVKNGYIVSYLHANGASMIFMLMYLHMARGLYVHSYIFPRRWLWWSGIVIFLLMMATAFIGYVLPWGQMSFWGATVITSLVTAMPFIGENIAYWLWGGFSISNATLVSFFSLHYLLPFLITGMMCLHLVVLHEGGSSNPTPVKNSDMMAFHPYFISKDSFMFTATLAMFMILVFFYPNLLGHPDNFMPADPLVTPAHMVPEWYFTPFYAILRSCPNKLGGVVSMLLAILVLFLLPFYKQMSGSICPTDSMLHKVTFWSFMFVFLTLMVLGGKPAAEPFVSLSSLFTVLYFSYFLLILPIMPYMEAWLLSIKSSSK